MKKPNLFIIAGPNGSGKTTITKQLLQHEWSKDCIYINPDEIAEELGSWNNLQDTLKAAQIAQEKRYQAIEYQKDIAFETVFSSPEKINFLQFAKSKNYFIRVFFISTDHPRINTARITDRVLAGGHDVPIAKIISRYYKSIAQAFKAIYIADRIYFYDNSIDNKVAEIELKFIDANLAKQYKNRLTPWVKEIQTEHQKLV